MTIVRLSGAAALVVSLGTFVGCGRAMTPSSPTPVSAAAAFVQSIPRPIITAPGTLTGKAIDVSVSFVEFQYNPDQRWFYAPQIHVDAGPQSAATLTGFSLTIPGLPGTMKFCGALQVPGGTQFDLFHEVYGDYELTIDNPGHRATEASGTATINLTDESGVATTRSLSAPIIPGRLPTTYSSGGGSGPWQFCR